MKANDGDMNVRSHESEKKRENSLSFKVATAGLVGDINRAQFIFNGVDDFITLSLRDFEKYIITPSQQRRL